MLRCWLNVQYNLLTDEFFESLGVVREKSFRILLWKAASLDSERAQASCTNTGFNGLTLIKVVGDDTRLNALT